MVGRVANAPGTHRVSRRPATTRHHKTPSRYPHRQRGARRGRPAPGATLRLGARCLRRSRTGNPPPAENDRPGKRIGRSCDPLPVGRAGRRRPTARWGRRPRTDQTPLGPHRRPVPSDPAGENGAAGWTPRAPTRSRCAGSGPPAPPCGSGFPASATRPAPAPAHQCGPLGAAGWAPAPQTRQPGSGGSSGPASPARCAPGCRMGRYGYRRRSRAPACRAAWSRAPHPGPGRSADSGTTRSPAPARGACAPPTTSSRFSSPIEGLPETVAGQAPWRGSPITPDARQGRFVLRRLSCVVATIAVPAADHHWPRPPPAPASPRRPTRPHRSGT